MSSVFIVGFQAIWGFRRRKKERFKFTKFKNLFNTTGNMMSLS